MPALGFLIELALGISAGSGSGAAGWGGGRSLQLPILIDGEKTQAKKQALEKIAERFFHPGLPTGGTSFVLAILGGVELSEAGPGIGLSNFQVSNQ